MTIRPVVSAAASELYDALSPTWTDQDEQYGWALLWFCEALCKNGLQPVYDYAFDDGARLGWTKLLDINLTPDAALPYLAQFVGVQTPASNSPAQNRALILARPASQRGTIPDLLAAVKATLIGSKSATLLERDTSPYHATIKTYTVQTPSPTATRAAIAAAKPAGLIIALTLLSAATFTQVRASKVGQTFNARKATYPLFSDVLNYVP